MPPTQNTFLSILLAATGVAAQEPEPPPTQAVAQAPQATETLVTARRREERPQDVPLSVTVIPGAELEATGTHTVREASLRIPNMLVTEFTSRRLSFPFIRGIGSGQGEPAVVTYVDGVPQLTSGSANLPLFDLDRVEFLRGPQGTLYGRNALGGVISLYSKRPTDDPNLKAGATLGNFDQQEYNLGWSGPLSDGRAWLDVAGLYSARDGFTTNLVTGNDVDSREAFFGRAALTLAPGDSDEIRIGVYRESARDGGFALGGLDMLRQNPFEIAEDFEGVQERDILAPSLTWRHFNESVELTTITSYQDWDVIETTDFDFTPIDGVRRGTTEGQEYFYQEVRLASVDEPLDVGRTGVDWVTGLTLFQADSDRKVANDFRPGGAGIFFPPTQVGVDTNTGNFDDLGFGLFGQATATFVEDFDLTVGLRYDIEQKEASLRQTFESGGITFLDVQQEFEDDFDQLSPHISAAWRPTESLLTYLSASTGFKAGGFNLNAPTGSFSFGPETSLSYELGAKQSFSEDRVHLSAALFYIDWQDQQLSLFDPVIGGFVDNAGDSTSKGIELEADAIVAEDWTLFGGLGFLDTEIGEYVDSFGQDTSGNSLPFAPENTWNLGAQYENDFFGSTPERRSSWYVRAEYVSIGEFFYDAGNVESESYDLAHFRTGVSWGALSLDLWMKNAFDETFFPVAFQANPTDPTQFVAETGAPRLWGVTLRGSF